MTLPLAAMWLDAASDKRNVSEMTMTDDKDARIAALEMELEAAKRDAEDCDLFLVCVEEAINELRAVLRRTPAGGDG